MAHSSPEDDNKPDMPLRHFWDQLRRRNVIRVAILYVVASWLVLQIAGLLLDLLAIPPWGLRLVFAVLLLGLPIALCFSWAYELTPEGLKREHTVPSDASSRAWTARRLDVITIVLLVAVAVGLGIDRFTRATSATRSTTSATAEDATTAAASDVSVAVLPFVNMSGDADNEYFSDGLTEELLNRIARLPGLRVTGRTSSFAFKGRDEDLRDIGTKLGVTNILEGSVRKSGNRVRVTAQLVDSSNGSHRWSSTYDRELGDIFAIQEEIAGAVARALSLTLGVPALSERPPTNSLQAYELYLQGRLFLARPGEAAIRQSIALFEQANALDPKFARAHSARAAAWAALPTFVRRSEREALQAAERAALQALALDPSIAEAEAVLAGSRAYLHHDLVGGEQHFRRAITLEPNDALSHLLHGQFLARVGLLTRARSELEHTLRLDPVSPATSGALALASYMLRDSDAALAYARQAQALGDPFGWLVEGQVLRDRGDLRLAATRLDQYGTRVGHVALLHGAAVLALKEPTQRPQVLRGVEENCPSGKLRPSACVFLYSVLGEQERALEQAKRLIDSGAAGRDVIWDPSFSPARRTQQFKAMVREAGLVEYWRTAGWPDLCKPRGDQDFECH